jgi:hypothetical protein
MRMMKKGGYTPSDRRLDRRKVVLAATAVLLFSTASARAAANVVDFVVNQTLSSLTVTSEQLLNALSPAYPNDTTVPQDGGLGIGTMTNYYGHLYIDVQPGSLQLKTGSSLSATQNGNWYPSEDNAGKVTLASTGVKQAGDYGLSYAFTGAKERLDGIRFDAHASSPVMPLSGINFNLGASNLRFTGGVSDMFNGPVLGLVPPFANFTKASLVTAPNALAGTPLLLLQGYVPPGVLPASLGSIAATGIAPWGSSGTWDGTTLILNIHAKELITAQSYHGIPTLLSFDGQIVYSATPEPSTFTLFGFGVAGLLGYAWRARNRRVRNS